MRNLQRSGLLIATALVAVLSASASEVTCASATGTVTFGDPSPASFTCGSVVFSNFDLNAVDGGAGSLTINGGEYNTVTGTVVLNIDPDLIGGQDDWLTYQAVASPGFSITGLDLAVGGVDASVTEEACSSDIPTLGASAYLCPKGTTLGKVSSESGAPDVPVFSKAFGETGPVYIFKDIGTGVDGSLSVVDQSFETSPAPEPASLLLLGGGLFGLGLWRRRKA